MSIEIKNLSFAYPGTGKPHGNLSPTHGESAKGVALANINLTIEQGERVGIIGRNGSGKTTLAKHINGLLTPTQGSVTVTNITINPASTRKARKKQKKTLHALHKEVGYLFQFPKEQLFGKTVLADIVDGLRNYGYTQEAATKKTYDLMERLYLPKALAERSPLHLSGGEARKVALAGVLAIEPSVLVLDEPTIGLDPKSSKELFTLLQEDQQKRKMTTIIISNNMEDLWDRVDRIVVIADGTVVADDSAHNILQNKALLESAHMVLPDHIAFLRTLMKCPAFSEVQHGHALPAPEDGDPASLDQWVGELESAFFKGIAPLHKKSLAGAGAQESWAPSVARPPKGGTP